MIKVRSDEDVDDEEEEGDDTCFRDLINSIGEVIKVWETPAICCWVKSNEKSKERCLFGKQSVKR